MPTDRVAGPAPAPTPATSATPTGSRPAAAPSPGPTPAAPDRFGGTAPDRAGQGVKLGARPDNEWWAGRPLSEARNAHRTNTKEQFQDALGSNANWFEGDIRKEINSDRMEMRHDEGHESGDNMTLREWLEAGVKTGKGLKLDVKEPGHMKEIMDEVERAGVPQERLMFNLGFGAFEEWGAELRRRFPDAILGLNPPPGDPIGKKEAEQWVAQARRLGGPVTFVAHHEKLTDEAIAVLRQHGPISVWGSGVDDVRGTTGKLRERGVNGMIDLSDHKPGVGDAADKAYNWTKTQLDKIF
ncbi:MAG TPA: DUF2181 domain-containing protein [Myxococcales bacterium]|nr:DUF2181 domain-containing protein [Myxococcales bacterium]